MECILLLKRELPYGELEVYGSSAAEKDALAAAGFIVSEADFKVN